jgi:hypothetical protein
MLKRCSKVSLFNTVYAPQAVEQQLTKTKLELADISGIRRH